MKLIEIDLPEYDSDNESDVASITKKLDDVIRDNFFGRNIVVRGVASSAHPAKTQDELIQIITESGTDRYDSNRQGDRYENVDNKHIDFFGVSARAIGDTEITHTIIWGFFHSAKAVHGHPARIDIITVYDADLLNQVFHRYEGRDDVKSDGFAFMNPSNKRLAVLGIIKVR